MSVRVFINAWGVDVPEGATALDAVRLWDAEAARAVESGTRALADSRGLPAAPDAPVYGGAIFRLVSARATRAGSADEPE